MRLAAAARRAAPRPAGRLPPSRARNPAGSDSARRSRGLQAIAAAAAARPRCRPPPPRSSKPLAFVADLFRYTDASDRLQAFSLGLNPRYSALAMPISSSRLVSKLTKLKFQIVFQKKITARLQVHAATWIRCNCAPPLESQTRSPRNDRVSVEGAAAPAAGLSIAMEASP